MNIRRLSAASLLAASALTSAAPAERAARRQHRRVRRQLCRRRQRLPAGSASTRSAPRVYTTGRFSGGTNYIDTLADLLGAPVDNFAIGGALAPTIRTPAAAVPAGLPVRSRPPSSPVGAGPPLSRAGDRTFDEDDLLAISIGGNDARLIPADWAGRWPARTCRRDSRRPQRDLRARRAGRGRRARTSASSPATPAGFPKSRQTRQAPRSAASFSSAFNTGMQSTLAGYAADGVIVHYLDLNLMLDNVIANPAAYGITNGWPASCPPSSPARQPAS